VECQQATLSAAGRALPPSIAGKRGGIWQREYLKRNATVPRNR
jgi:hypothetical protein